MEHDEFHTLLTRFIQRQGVRRWLFNETTAHLEECTHLEPIAVGRHYVKSPRPSDDLLKRGVKPTICAKEHVNARRRPDVGDTYVFHHYDGGCAMGFVLGSQKFHPVLPSFAHFGLVEQPKDNVRRFAVDLTSHHVDFIETSRVEENLFLIAIRRSYPHPNGYPLANQGEVRLYRANASLLNQFASSGSWSLMARCLALRFSIKEAAWCFGPVDCRFCSALGRGKCECSPQVLTRSRELNDDEIQSGDHNAMSHMMVGNWTRWRQFLQGVQCNGHMVAHWRTVDLDGDEMMFLSNSTAYSLHIDANNAAKQRISRFYSTSGPHESCLSIPRVLSTPTVTLQSTAALEGALNELSTAMSLPLQTSDAPLITSLPATDLPSTYQPPTYQPSTYQPSTYQPSTYQVDLTVTQQLPLHQNPVQEIPQTSSTQVLSRRAPQVWNFNETFPSNAQDFSLFQRDHQPLEYSIARPIGKRAAQSRRPRSTTGVDEEGRPVQIWTCEQCGQRIRGKKGNYNRHIAVTHRNELRFRCMFEGCGQVFGYKLNAQRHFVNKHLSRTYPCAKCQRTFKSEGKRDSHVASVHDPAKESYDCGTCGAAFGRKSTLNRHVKNMHS